MKLVVCYFLLSYLSIEAQGIIEYDSDYNIDFTAYNNTVKLFKLQDEKQIDNSTPEGLIQSYFFALNNKWLKESFLDTNDFTPKNNTHYIETANMLKDSNFITLLHKFSYKHNEIEMCFINFIFKYQNINYTIPTNISCIKKDNRWYIYQLGNQININEILWTFKSCVLLDIFDGNEDKNPIIGKLIKNIKVRNNAIDINRLYYQYKNFDEKELGLFTMSEDNICEKKGIYEVKAKRVISSFLWDSLKITTYSENNFKNETIAINSLKTKQTDSFIVKSKLEFKYNNTKYVIIKYENFNTKQKQCFSNVNNSIETPIKEFLEIFKIIDTKLLLKLCEQNEIDTGKDKNLKIIFEKSRGQLNSLNTTKLYNLLKNQKQLFLNYIEN